MEKHTGYDSLRHERLLEKEKTKTKKAEAKIIAEQFKREKFAYKQKEEARKRNETKKKAFFKDVSKLAGREAANVKARWKQEYASKGRGKVEYVGAWKSSGLASKNAYSKSEGINPAFKSNSFKGGR